MINIDITKLPKKLNEVCYFKKCENGVKIYNYSNKNKDLMTIIELECEIEQDFAIAGSTLEMVRKLNPAVADIVGNEFVIESKKATFKGKLLETNLLIPNTKANDDIWVNVKALKVLSEFTSENDKKPVLCGINVKTDGTMVATDSFKLARYKSDRICKEDANITIPKTFVDLIKNEAEEENIVLSYNNNSVIFKKDNITYVSTLIAGAYPNVDRIFTNSYRQSIELNTLILKESVNLARNVGLENIKEKYLPLTFENGTLKANGTDYFETMISDKNDEYLFVLASTSFELVLKNIVSETLHINYTSDSAPLEIVESGIEYILLPMRVDR